METKVIRIEIKFTRATLALLLGLVLLLAGLGIAGAALAQPPDPEARGEGEAALASTLSASDVVSSAINYQGRLTDNNTGNPLDGIYDMEFQLWDAESGGSQVGSTITVNNVGVDQGLFNVRLEVDPDDFNGQELWLRVRAREHGGTWDDWMTPLQEILPVPYALSLRPGAVISGTYPAVGQGLVHVQQGETGSNGEGQYGAKLVYDDWGWWSAGVHGYAYDVGSGVSGHSHAGNYSAGVSGHAYATTTTNYGGYFSSQSDMGYGVYASNTSGTAIYGDGDVKQNRTGDGLVKAAVFARCHSSGSTIHRSFNNVNSASITIGSGGGAGQCTIDFGFDVSDRYVVASANTTGASILDRGVTVRNQSGTSVVFFRYNADNGAGTGGDIAVLVY